MRFYLVFILFFYLHCSYSQTLTLNFTGLRNAKGHLQIHFYTNKIDFDKEKPSLTRIVPKTQVKQGTLSISYNDIPPGTYGIAILDDENSNKKMDYGFMLPEEGFGFSDYYHTGFTRPDYDRFKFNFQQGNKQVVIRVRYL